LVFQQGAVFTVPATMSALEAFGQMAIDHKSSLGVTDPKTGVCLLFCVCFYRV
jgi:hypothetical protein